MWRTPISLLIVLCFGAIAQAQVRDADGPRIRPLDAEQAAADNACMLAFAELADGGSKRVPELIQKCTTKADRGVCEIAIETAARENVKLPSNFVCRQP
jgi:hypothetical protein